VSQPLNPSLPAPLVQALDDAALDAEGTAFQLLTVRPDGWPHVSMLSVGEIVVRSDRELRLALWPGSNAAANAAATAKATLVTVVDGVPYSVRLSLGAPTQIPSPDHGHLVVFCAHVVEVRVDSASYAEVLSGIRFRLHEPENVLRRWTQTREVLSRSHPR
jgi:hypothetical protein